jgi:hypothetical protein
MATQNRNSRVERLARLEETTKSIDDRLECVERKLDEVRMKIAHWSGQFAVISAVTAAITAGIVSLIVWIIVH